jgi:hypothetical protein
MYCCLLCRYWSLVIRVRTSKHFVLHAMLPYVPEETASAVLSRAMVAVNYLNLNRVCYGRFSENGHFVVAHLKGLHF